MSLKDTLSKTKAPLHSEVRRALSNFQLSIINFQLITRLITSDRSLQSNNNKATN